MQGRPPHGGRGLKYCVHVRRGKPFLSPPARGAWIEMSTIYASFIGILLSLPARGAWIEIMMEGYSIYRMLSDRAKDLKAKADAK